MKNMKLIIPIVVVLAVAVGAGLVLTMSNKKDSSTPSKAVVTAPSDAVATDSVTIQSYAYAPKVITVKVGTKVTWTNKDSVHHSVTADNASADAPKSELFGQNESYSFTFNKAGTYDYHCEPHPYMKGTVVVTN